MSRDKCRIKENGYNNRYRDKKHKESIRKQRQLKKKARGVE